MIDMVENIVNKPIKIKTSFVLMMKRNVKRIMSEILIK